MGCWLVEWLVAWQCQNSAYLPTNLPTYLPTYLMFIKNCRWLDSNPDCSPNWATTTGPAYFFALLFSAKVEKWKNPEISVKFCQENFSKKEKNIKGRSKAFPTFSNFFVLFRGHLPKVSLKSFLWLYFLQNSLLSVLLLAYREHL